MHNYSIFTLIKLRNTLIRKAGGGVYYLSYFQYLAIFDVISVASIIPFLTFFANNNENNLVNYFSF